MCRSGCCAGCTTSSPWGGEPNQSINQRSLQRHTRARERPYRSTTTGGQQTLHHEAMQAWGAVSESQQH